MVQFENQYRQIKVKIVYYGPALGGKTTCLQHIHRATDPQRRTRLYSLNTASDRTLFFDLLSLNLGQIRGYRLAIQLYTVPGQVQYNATRRTVLAGADGVVFVADSQDSQRWANTQALHNLKENLEANGIDPSSLPMVMAYNKRDLAGIMAVEAMESELNAGSLPSFPTVAITGDGVMSAFAAITENTLASLADRLGIDASPQAVNRLRQQTRTALEPFMDATVRLEADEEVMVTLPAAPNDETGPLPQEALVSEAVRANLAMTDLSARFESVNAQLERRVSVTRAIIEFGRSVANERDPAEVIRRLIRTAVSQLGVTAAAVLIARGEGGLREAVVHGLEKDPLLAAEQDGVSPADTLAAAGEPVLVIRDLEGETTGPAQLAVERAGFGSAIAVPLTARSQPIGLLTIYSDRKRRPLEDDELELASILGATAAMGYTNALAFRRLEESNAGLKSSVDQRSDELRTTIDEVQRLNRELEERGRQKGEILARVADRLEQPMRKLATAAGALHRLRDAPVDKTARFIDIVRSEVERLAETVESVSQAAVVVADERDVPRRPTPLPVLLSEAVAPLRDLARRLEVGVKILSPGNLETISCDPEGLTSALRAVVKNAIEHTPSGGAVRIEVHRVLRREKAWLMVTVSDTGAGIPEADRERALDLLWQGSPPRPGVDRGIGLGLAVARQVIHRHGGRIAVTEGDGGGTRVVLEIPQPED
ncbi:MAG: ATP-binding protein [Thermoanaerobaculales bacterium]|jgi:signal transduction histidine kinase/signal recognition particle receptor subunit beta|nr:ATP-binding protein [Thermoanaerobaculales bacterium]